MINKLRYAVGGLIVLLAMAGLLRLRSCVKASMPQASKPHAVLPRDVKEQVSINSEKHTVTVTTQTGSKTEFAKDPIISVNKTGDVWLGLFTAAIVARVVLVLRGHGPINMAEATAYGSAVGAFAYSKHGGPKQS